MCSASCLQLPPHQKGCSRKPLFTFRHTQKQTFKMIRVVWPECLWSTLSYLWKCSQRLCSRLRPLLHVIPLLSFPNFQCIFNVTSVLEKCHKNNILGKKLCFFCKAAGSLHFLPWHCCFMQLFISLNVCNGGGECKVNLICNVATKAGCFLCYFNQS